MALWFQLMINGDAFGFFEAKRRAIPGQMLSNDEVTPDMVFEYEIRVDGREIGIVRHRYGDGRWALIMAGLDLLRTAEAHDDMGRFYAEQGDRSPR